MKLTAILLGIGIIVKGNITGNELMTYTGVILTWMGMLKD